MKHLKVPENFRQLYKRCAFCVYDDISGDCPEVEGYSKKAVVEIVRDANRISMATQNLWLKKEQPEVVEFRTWMKKNEYAPEYGRDMDRAVREALYGD